MPGKPAARQGDAVSHGLIVQGSNTVLIGTQGGIACSVCPGGMAVGSPVNPALGAKVLTDETDFALPAPVLPLIWTRAYSSYVNPEHGGACGLLGYGWTLPTEYRLDIQPERTLLFDTAGRAITFPETLAPGAALHSRSESLWLLRGAPDAPWAKDPAWRHIPRDWAADPDTLLATSADKTHLWRFAPLEGEAICRLVERRNRLGASQRLTYTRPDPTSNNDTPGEQPLLLQTLTDGAGRLYRLHHQQLFPPRPATGPGHRGQAGWQADNGWRLTAVELIAADTALVRYRYNDTGDLTHVIDRTGRTLRTFDYHNHLLIAHRHRNGPEHRYTYEAPEPGARVLQQTNQGGLHYHFTYHDTAPDDTTTHVTDSLERRQTYHFTGQKGLKRLARHTRPDGSKITLTHNFAGHLTLHTDPLGHQTQTHHDGEGRLVATTNPLGHRTRALYDELGQLTEQEDLAGRITRYRYDDWGRLTHLIHPDGSREHYEYPAPDTPLAALPIRLTDPQGGVTQFQWNNAGQLIAHTDCAQRTTHAQYDPWGQLTSTTDPLGQRTEYTRDEHGNLTALRLPDGKTLTYHYDDRDRLIQTTFGEHHHHYSWDDHDRLTQHTNPAGHTRRVTYDQAGRLTVIQNENRALCRLDYNQMDRLERETGFDDRTRLYYYDLLGRLTAQTDVDLPMKPSIRYEYDPVGHLTTRHLPNTDRVPALSEYYRWSPDGRLLTAAGPGVRLDITYDRLGRLKHERQRIHHTDDTYWEWQHAHQHTPLGVRKTSTYGNLPPVQWLTYGPGHLHGVRLPGLAIDIDRDPLHRETERHYHTPARPLLASRQDHYDLAGNLRERHITQHLDTGGTLHLIRRHTYDPLNRLTDIEGNWACQRTHYTYDPANRLIASQHNITAHRYAFDPAGNRVDPSPLTAEEIIDSLGDTLRQRIQDPDFDPLDPQADEAPPLEPGRRWPDNRIAALDGVQNTYDGAGNLIEQRTREGLTHYLYDGAHRLRQLHRTDRDGNEILLAWYLYDPLSRRVCKGLIQNGGPEKLIRYGWDQTGVEIPRKTDKGHVAGGRMMAICPCF